MQSSSSKIPKQSSMITTQDAIYLLGQKLSELDSRLTKTISLLETKLGNYETTMTEGKIDNENINDLFSTINTRILDLESFNDRITNLETNANIKPANSSKKKSVKLNELTDNTPIPVAPVSSVSSVSSPGISFT